jgi:hypothetical protein
MEIVLNRRTEKNKNQEYIIMIIVTIFIIFSFLVVHQFFQHIDKFGGFGFTVEILASIIGSSILIGVMAMMLRMQVLSEQKREYSIHLFENKLKIYQDLLSSIFKSDDDNIITKDEIMTIENNIGLACLVANEVLVNIIAQFAYQLKIYGIMYFRSMNERQKKSFVDFLQNETNNKKNFTESILAQEQFEMGFSKIKYESLPEEEKDKYLSSFFISLDNLIQGVREDLAVVEGDIKSSVENFISCKYDKLGLFKKPNVVDSKNDFK